jgi:hypothetical protein
MNDSSFSVSPSLQVLSLSDLSVWCYACNEYVKHDRLLPLLIRAGVAHSQDCFNTKPGFM